MTDHDLIVNFPSLDDTPTDTAPSHLGTPSPRRRHSIPMRRVSFHEEVLYTKVENLSNDYKSDLWFNKLEMKQFKSQTVSELRRLASNENPSSYITLLESNDDTTHFLGLESCLSKKVHFEIALRKKALRKAIMFEQHRQRINGIYDPDLLANVSEVESDWARRRASLVAMLHDDSSSSI